MASLGEELLNIVNRLQDLVFNTIGNDSLDLPQIVCSPALLAHADGIATSPFNSRTFSHICNTDFPRSS